MTTTASFNTPDRIIRYAMKDAGLLMEGSDPNPEQLAEYSNRLNDLINAWQTQGIKLWTQEDLSITLVAGTGTYTLGPSGSVVMTKPLRILQGYYLDVNSIRRPIYPLSWDEWLRLSNVTQQGPVTQYFVDKQQTQLSVSTWLIPDTTAATGTMHLLLQQQITNFTGLTDTLNFPQEWFMALRWGLAADICSGQPAAVIQRCEAKAESYRTALENWDVEDTSIFFSPDNQRGPYLERRFR